MAQTMQIPPTSRSDAVLYAALAAHPYVAAVVPHVTAPVWAVGGVVRDALTDHPPGPDVDLVVEGDAVEQAWQVGRALGVRPGTHERFGTAVVELEGGHVDLVTARREHYPHPGALPEVSPGSLEDDLARRDFTVNAIAVAVAGPRRGEVADPYGGRRDLVDGVLRTLRADAFEEDPSRVVRAARYAGRLHLEPEAVTVAGLVDVAPRLDWSSARVAEELRRLLDEADPAPCLSWLARWGAPGVVATPDPSIAAIDRSTAALGVANPPRWALRLGVALAAETLPAVALPGWATRAAEEVADAAAVSRAVGTCGRPSEVDALLSATPIGTLVALHAQGDPRLAAWWELHRQLEIAVTGADLVRLGVTPGPQLGAALRGVRAATIDGEVTTPDEQRQLALRLAATP